MSRHRDQQPFRTISGQTGKDAYTFELAQIRNEYRDLKARLARLTETIVEELPEGATSTFSEDVEIPFDREGLVRVLPMFGLDDTSLQDLGKLVRNLDTSNAPTFEPGQEVTILDYPSNADHDQRAGKTATVKSAYNGVVMVDRDGYIEAFLPSRLEIRCADCVEHGCAVCQHRAKS